MQQYVAEDDGWALGGYLRDRLSPRARHELVGYLLSRVDPSVVVEFDAGGWHWRAPAGDIITGGLFANGNYQGDAIGACVDWVAAHRATVEDPWVIDIGANIGTTSLPWAAGGYRVLAIEPAPDVHATLAENVRRNHLEDRITTADCAIYPSSTNVTLSMTSHGTGSLGDSASADGATEVQVDAMPLSEVAAAHGLDPGSVAIVWCDAEGSESYVIETGAALWSAGVPLFAEINPLHLDRVDSTTRFLELATQHFSAFIGRAELVGARRDAVARPIADLAATLDRVGDALLLPRSA